MACCKGGTSVVPKQNTDTLEMTTGLSIKNYTLKIFIFMIMLALTPIIMLGVVWLLFKNIVLSKNIDIMPLFRDMIKKLNKKLKGPELEDDEDEEFTVYNPDEYQLLNVEKIN